MHGERADPKGIGRLPDEQVGLLRRLLSTGGLTA
jgi:hypothetical protein